MNAAQLARSAYASALAPIRTDRGTEYEVIARITHNISAAMALGKTGFASLASALHDNRKLWTILAADVAESDNGLPKQLRAQIFYLARFTEIHTRKILAGDATADPLVDINTSVMRGLRTSGRATS